MTRIYINDIAIAGKVGEEIVIFSVQDLWTAYLQIIRETIDNPVTMLPELASWKVDNKNVQSPSSWFIQI